MNEQKRWALERQLNIVFLGEIVSVPSSPPESPKCDVLSSTSIYVTWSPPPIDSQNGKVKGYKVSYIASAELYEKEMQMLKSSNQYLTVENLQKYTNYSFWVLAYTKMGDGVKTKQFFCTTHEDGKWTDRDFNSIPILNSRFDIVQ